ncbi:MAG: hypothetical protein DI576_13830 [Actinomyces sp.]|nr:MAG: hypothetical protein DI576_13830 [Actinomyces sp.]
MSSVSSLRQTSATPSAVDQSAARVRASSSLARLPATRPSRAQVLASGVSGTPRPWRPSVKAAARAIAASGPPSGPGPADASSPSTAAR